MACGLATMPPVAPDNATQEDFVDVLERVAVETGTSWRQLARRLHELDPDRQSEDNWKRSVNRHRAGDANPSERTIKLYAKALGVSRATFPAAVTRREAEIRRLQRRVVELESEVVSLLEQLRLRQAGDG